VDGLTVAFVLTVLTTASYCGKLIMRTKVV